MKAEIDEFKSKFETYRQEAKKVNESNELRIKEVKLLKIVYCVIKVKIRLFFIKVES